MLPHSYSHLQTLCCSVTLPSGPGLEVFVMSFWETKETVQTATSLAEGGLRSDLISLIVIFFWLEISFLPFCDIEMYFAVLPQNTLMPDVGR